MQTFNIQYQDDTQLIDYINDNNIASYKNILVQVFSGIVDEKICLDISTLIKTHLKDANIIGTTTAGEILDGKMYDETILISFTVFKSTSIRSKLFDLEKDFDINNITETLVVDDTKALIIFSDGLKSNAEELLKDITSIDPKIVIAGGRAADFIKFEKTFVFDDSSNTQNGFVIASLSGSELIVNSDYMLNWNQIGREMRVTKAKGNIVYEINNMKIKDLYKKYLGAEVADNLPSAGSEFPLITVRKGIKVARSPISILDDGSFLFGGNLNVGEKVKFSYGNLNDIKNSIYENNVKFSKLPIESIFVYSCSSRKTLMGKELEAEFDMLSSLATTSGFFTYGEYFHSSNINELLNITTTFLALSEDSSSDHKDISIVKKSEENRILKALTHLTAVTTKEIEFKNHELSRLNDMISETVLYSTSDLDGNIISISHAYLKFLKLSAQEVIGKNHSIFKHPDTKVSFYTRMWEKLTKDETFIDDIKNKRRDGSEYWIRLTINPMYNEDGEKVGYSSYREDVTDKKLLEYISAHDSLTGLYNRGEFSNRIKAKIKSAKRYGENFGFAIFDIDYFKKVNDIYGHKVGDDVLVKISECLSDNIRDDDFVARWGGEEFVIIANYTTIENLIVLIKKLQIAISNTSFLPVPKVTMSFGLTTYQDGDTKDSLLKRADRALYIAKESGRDRYEVL